MPKKSKADSPILETLKHVLSELELLLDKMKAVEAALDNLDQRVNELECEIEVDPDFDLEEWDD